MSRQHLLDCSKQMTDMAKWCLKDPWAMRFHFWGGSWITEKVRIPVVVLGSLYHCLRITSKPTNIFGSSGLGSWSVSGVLPFWPIWTTFHHAKRRTQPPHNLTQSVVQHHPQPPHNLTQSVVQHHPQPPHSLTQSVVRHHPCHSHPTVSITVLCKHI